MSLSILFADDPVWPQRGGFRLFLPGPAAQVMAFLDAVTAMDAPGTELWAGYDARQGTAFFSIDGRRSGMRADWISSVWQKHFGIGAHVVRTLWHELVRDGTEDRTYIALGLCAQRSARAAAAYRLTYTRAADLCQGRDLLRAERGWRETDRGRPMMRPHRPGYSNPDIRALHNISQPS